MAESREPCRRPGGAFWWSLGVGCLTGYALGRLASPGSGAENRARIAGNLQEGIQRGLRLAAQGAETYDDLFLKLNETAMRLNASVREGVAEAQRRRDELIFDLKKESGGD